MLSKVSFEKTDFTFVRIKNVLSTRIDMEMQVTGQIFFDILEGHHGHFLRHYFVISLFEPIVQKSTFHGNIPVHSEFKAVSCW